MKRWRRARTEPGTLQLHEMCSNLLAFMALPCKVKSVSAFRQTTTEQLNLGMSYCLWVQLYSQKYFQNKTRV